MRKRASIFLFLMVGLMTLQAHNLKFNDKGHFKIIQFTDVHFIADDPRSDVALETIDAVIKAENPDLVMLTGDVIFGKPAEKSMRTILDQVAKHDVPFAVTFGNHDDEQGLTRAELYDIIKSYPNDITGKVEGISGVTNFILPVRSSDGKRDAEIIYVFDSHSYSDINGVGGYACIKFDQIQWYRQMSKQFTDSNNGKPNPSIAFFHRALPEFHQAVESESAPMFGIRKERACSPNLNSGLFASMKEMGDVQGIFVGHDHDNDYSVMWQDILLAYGRYSGGNTVYNNVEKGARIIEFTEGENGFRTWIRTRDGNTEQVVKFPESYLRPRK